MENPQKLLGQVGTGACNDLIPYCLDPEANDLTDSLKAFTGKGLRPEANDAQGGYKIA